MSLTISEKVPTPDVASETILPQAREEQTASTLVADHTARNGTIPSLQSGDRLTRTEFERRYHAYPEIKKAELIEGVVYLASPVRAHKHGIPHSRIIGWLFNYQAATPNILVADNSTLRLDLDNEPQPDVCVWIDGGGAFVDDDDYLQGAPELLVEVAGSSAAIDLRDKFRAYRRNGVGEYLILLTHEQEVHWYSWKDDEMVQIKADENGVLHSSVLPGLRLHLPSFWTGDLAGVLQIVQEGLASPEHAEFVAQLSA